MFTQRLSLTNQDARKVNSNQLHVLGSVAETADGRVYRYARVGASNLAPGKLNVNPDVDSNVVNKAVTAASAIGSYSVVFTAGGAILADAYKDGYLVVNDATGEGVNYAVNGNTAGTAVTVTLKDPVVVALVASTSEVTLKKSSWADVVISVADQADQPVGVCNVAATAANFAWLQTGGECSVLNDASTVTKGLELTISAATVGAVGLKDAAGEATVGVATEPLTSTEYRSAFLTIN